MRSTAARSPWQEGSITALIGPNGAGKTTVFNLISGLHRPDSGAILFDGARIDGLPPHRITRKGVARTFQISRDLAGLSVLENMVVQSPAGGLRHLLQPSMSPAERERATELLSFVGIAELAQEPAARLSYGQKKLLELAACLMAEPRLVLLDEPAGGINPALLEIIIDRVRQLQRPGRHVPDRRAQHGRGDERVRSGRGHGLRQIPGPWIARGHPE